MGTESPDQQRELSSHAGVCQPLPDICVLLCQQLLTTLHSHLLSVERTKAHMQDLALGT